MDRQSQTFVTLTAALLLHCWQQPAAAQPAAAQPAAAQPEPAQDSQLAQAPPAPDVSPGPARQAPLQVRLRALLARPGGLTSEEAARRAAQSSPTARARDLETEAAGADVSKANVAAFPRLNLTARYTRLSPIEEPSMGPGAGSMVVTSDGAQGPLPAGQQFIGVPFSVFSFPTLLNQYYLQATVSVPLSDYLLRTRQTIRTAEYVRESAGLQARAARLEAASQARVAYYNWVGARLQQVVSEQSLAQASAHLATAERAFEAGTVSKADVLRAESMLASAQLLVQRAKNVVTLSEDRLRSLMHDASGKHYEIGEDILARARRVPPPGAFERLYAEAQRNRLELKAMEEIRASLAQARQAARAGNVPRLQAFANAYYANPHPRYFPQQEQWRASWDAGLLLSWSPNDFGMANADISGYEAQRARVEAERSALQDALRTQVLAARQAIEEAQTAMRTSARGLRAAEEGYRVRGELYTYGRATSVEVVDAETDVLQARLQVIDAQVKLLVAQAQLEHAVGRDVR